MIRAEHVTVEADEAGFVLTLWLDEEPEIDNRGRITIGVQNVAPELYAAVKREIGPWIAEMEAARAAYDSGVANDPAEQPTLDRIKREESNRWPGEDPMSYYQRTGDDAPLREAADVIRDRAKDEGR